MVDADVNRKKSDSDSQRLHQRVHFCEIKPQIDHIVPLILGEAPHLPTFRFLSTRQSNKPRRIQTLYQELGHSIVRRGEGVAALEGFRQIRFYRVRRAADGRQRNDGYRSGDEQEQTNVEN